MITEHQSPSAVATFERAGRRRRTPPAHFANPIRIASTSG